MKNSRYSPLFTEWSFPKNRCKTFCIESVCCHFKYLMYLLLLIEIMFSIVTDNLKEDLNFLQEQPSKVLPDFCKLVWNVLQKKDNPKLYQEAAQKLQVDAEKIQSGVESLAYFFIEARKNALNEESFRELIVSLGFSENAFDTIYGEYLSKEKELEFILHNSAIQHFAYKDLEWRFEAQVSSKSIKDQIQPRVIMKLELQKGDETKKICLQSDIPNMIHMSQLLSEALQESTTQHSKRIIRAVT